MKRCEQKVKEQGQELQAAQRNFLFNTRPTHASISISRSTISNTCTKHTYTHTHTHTHIHTHTSVQITPEDRRSY